MRVANDAEVRVQVYCRNFLVLLLLLEECTLFVVVISIAGGLIPTSNRPLS